MSAKKLKDAHDPSWTEVTLGAVLSVALGAVIGAVLLVMRPVATVKELPKEADRAAGTVYYVEGSRDSAKAKQAPAKRKQFAQGATVVVTEDEINSFIAPPPPTPPPAAKPKAGEKAKAGDKAAPAAPAPSGDLLTPGSPNFRIREGVVQIGVPVTVNLFGLIEQKVVVVARGAFAKNGDKFTFNSDSLTVGSCPMQRFPFAAGFVEKKVLGALAVPEDIAAAWPKLADVKVEGNTLTLAMP
jgi:hypothetical protein